MEVTARLKYLRQAPRKVRLVADLIRGKDVETAASLLKLSKKSAARSVEKLLTSAIANAENRDEPIDVRALHLELASVQLDLAGERDLDALFETQVRVAVPRDGIAARAAGSGHRQPEIDVIRVAVVRMDLCRQ